MNIPLSKRDLSGKNELRSFGIPAASVMMMTMSRPVTVVCRVTGELLLSPFASNDFSFDENPDVVRLMTDASRCVFRTVEDGFGTLLLFQSSELVRHINLS